MDDQLLLSLVPFSTPTHRGGESADSTINFIFANPSAFNICPSTCSISFSYSRGSDHAGLLLPLTILLPPTPITAPFSWKVDDTSKDLWIARFAILPNPPIINTNSLYAAASQLLLDINDMCETLFVKRLPRPTQGFPWWDDSCCIALATVHTANNADTRHQAYSLLCLTLKTAKQNWFENLITDPDTNLWDITAW